MHLLFVYGTLKEDYANNVLLRGTELLGEAVTVDKFNMIDMGVPTVSLPMSNTTIEAAKPIVGELYKISSSVLIRVDTLEGHPELYRRTLTKIKLLETYEIVDAYIYLIHINETQFSDYSCFTDKIKVTEQGYIWNDVLICTFCGAENTDRYTCKRCDNVLRVFLPAFALD